MERLDLAAEGLEPLHRAIRGDGEVEHLEPAGRIGQIVANGARIRDAFIRTSEQRHESNGIGGFAKP